MRSPMSKFMMVPRKVAEYHEDFNNITLDLLKNIELKKHPDTSMLTDVPRCLFNWSFEGKYFRVTFSIIADGAHLAAVAFFSLGKRFGALNLDGTTPESQEIIDAVERFFRAVNEMLFSIPLYKIYPTKTWKTLVNSLIIVNEQAMKATLKAASGEEEVNEKVDIITYLVRSGKMSVEEVSVCVGDLIIAGVETVSISFVCSIYKTLSAIQTSYTLGWMLYLLALSLASSNIYLFLDFIHSCLDALSAGYQPRGPGEAEE